MRALIVSHPSVLAVNQLPYVELARRGWDVHVVVPSRWQHDYSAAPFRSETHPELGSRVIPMPVAFPGRVQRHFYLARPSRLITRLRPDVAFLDQEFFSVVASQWGAALRHHKVPFGVQADENLFRDFSLPAKAFTALTLDSAAFVAARSPTAARVVRSHGFGSAIFLVPHHVPEWLPGQGVDQPGPLVLGFAGRLVPEKGIDTLIDAASLMRDVKVRLFGNGSAREELIARAAALDVELEVITHIRHGDMSAAYAQMDVLVLPSRTTPTWSEQFGRVLVEALWCGTPVVGSSSGEIPWVIETTGGGRVFSEGDPESLRTALEAMRDSKTRTSLAAVGRQSVERFFSVPAVADRLETALTAFSPWHP